MCSKQRLMLLWVTPLCLRLEIRSGFAEVCVNDVVTG